MFIYLFGVSYVTKPRARVPIMLTAHVPGPNPDSWCYSLVYIKLMKGKHAYLSRDM